MKIGIIGYGVVGKAVHNSLPENHEVYTYDIGDKLKKCDAYFVCVPTPTRNGDQDLNILHTRLRELYDLGTDALIIVKSTMLPETQLPPSLNIMVSPEFLNQFEPYFKADKHIVGVRDITQAKLYREIFKGMPYDEVRTTDINTACMIKYVHNIHGALKVTFFNEIFDVCEKAKVNYREMIGGLLAINDNVGKQYTTIGSDGQRGYGGVCFPKDIVSFNSCYQTETLGAAIKKNRAYRKDEMGEVCLK
jgi:UDPglucose 6-dehydrogenase